MIDIVKALDEKWFKEKYCQEGLSQSEIAKLMNSNRSSVQRWMKKLNIKAKKPSQAFLGKNLSIRHKQKIKEARLKNNPGAFKSGENHRMWKGGKKDYCGRIAKEIWEEYWREKVPKGYHLHHFDKHAVLIYTMRSHVVRKAVSFFTLNTFGPIFKRMQFIATFALLVLFISPLLAAEQTGLYLSGFGMVTSAKNIGYNKDAPGVEGKFTLLTNRIGFALNGYYSTAKKVATHQGYGSGGTLKALYRVTGRLFISSGVKLRYYTAGLWEKKAYLWTVGVTYGFPEDLIQIDISHAFKEHQTISECAITSVELTSTLFKGRWIGLQLRSTTNIIEYNYGEIRKTGISGELGIDILFHL